MNKILLSLSTLLAFVITASAQNSVSFDNQSGEPALVKLIGPTPKDIEVPDGTKQAVQALAGKYFIKVRYGFQGKYHYTKGQEFTVDETATTTSDITITLHKVVNGNYDSSPINEQEFGRGNAEVATTNGNAATARTTGLDSTNAPDRMQAVAQITDQTVLAKVALDNKDWAVRDAALDKLTNQAVLAKLAVKAAADEDDVLKPIGVGAVKKLTDQTLLAKIAMELQYGYIGYAAWDALKDQAVLAQIAQQAEDPGNRISALKKLTDQVLLAKIAEEDKDKDVRSDAFDHITDESLLAKLVTDNRVANIESRHKAIAKLHGTHFDFQKLAGNLSTQTFDAAEAVSRINLVFTNQIVTARMPNSSFSLDVDIQDTSQSYSSLPGTAPGGALRFGETVKIILKQRTNIIASNSWTTDFPSGAIKDSYDFVPAEVDVSGLMESLFHLPGFTQEDLIQLSQSEIPEMRAGATANLHDQALLTKIVSQDKTVDVCVAAIKNLNDQALLARIAVGDNENAIIRNAAIGKLTDQTLLTNIAWETTYSYIVGHKKPCVVAVETLTNQDLLAKFTGKGVNWELRLAAVGKLTDQSLLVKLAAEDDVADVRYAASNRLKELGASKP